MSGRKRRDSTQIRYELLMAALPGEKKTHMMYESGLNLKQLNLYMNELASSGALEFRGPEKRYYATEKGRTFLRAYDRYREIVSMLDKQEAVLAEFFLNPTKSETEGQSVAVRF